MDLEKKLKAFIHFGLNKDQLRSALDNICCKNSSESSYIKEKKDQFTGNYTRISYEYEQGYKFYPHIIWIPILSFYGGDYRLEYDGKYISLYGKDKNYETFSYGGKQEDSFEEMLLIPIVKEIRYANPQIIQVTDIEIVIDLGVKI